VKVGDLVISKNRYKGLYFIVTQMIQPNEIEKRFRTLIKCYNRSYQTRWCDAANWEIVSESR